MEGDSPTLTTKKRKRPKVEEVEIDDDTIADADAGEAYLQEQEEALVALIDYRSKEVDHLRQRTNYYRSQLQEAEKGLSSLHTKLGVLRSRINKSQPKSSVDGVANGLRAVKQEKRSPSPINVAASQTQTKTQMQMQTQTKTQMQMQTQTQTQTTKQTKPQLMIPSVKPKATSSTSTGAKFQPPVKAVAEGGRATPPPRPTTEFVASQSSSSEKQKKESLDVSSRDIKRKKPNVRKESKDVIPSVRSHSSPSLIHLQMSTHISSQHTRRLRCLGFNPYDDQQFFTSALDGVLNLWQVTANGSAVSLRSTTQCSSLKRRWPEDIVWHPYGDSLFAVYTADGGESQVSVINPSAPRERRVTFLEGKPHIKGIINNIQFMPWSDLMFVTGGSDHAVIRWQEKDDGSSWKPQSVHRNLHSSAVIGVAGLQHKTVILSVGADKRIIGYDLASSRSDYKNQLDSKCMSVLTNPLDFNLFVVQTGSPGKQLRLFDIRVRQMEIHAFGWKQESSESQSALINPAWSPDGFYLSSGSADPMIHIFDIRYKGTGPSQSIPAHQKRVFKAAWHQKYPLLVSISSDLNIGLHTIS